MPTTIRNRLIALKRYRRHLLLGIAIAAIGAGVYLILLIYVFPHRDPIPKSTYQAIIQKDYTKVRSKPDKRLIIPSIGVQADIIADNLKLLDKGYIIQRSKSGGNPVTGGNFVLTGHRFMFGLTPQRVRQNSVLFDLDKVKVGDKIALFWEHKLYTYSVKRLYKVKPESIGIESPSTESKLTIYTCTLGGTYDGRLVLEAFPSTAQ